MSWTLGVEWPTVFQEYLGALSIFSFDFVATDCVGEGANFYRTVYFWSGFPVAVFFLLLLSYSVRMAAVELKAAEMGTGDGDGGDTSEAAEAFKEQ